MIIGIFEYSRTSIIRHSIIRNLDYPAWKFSKKIALKMGVSAAVTMDTGMFVFCACADAHIHCCLSIKWVDQGVVYPIRLSGLFSYPAWLRNKGVRIIEVLLVCMYMLVKSVHVHVLYILFGFRDLRIHRVCV